MGEFLRNCLGGLARFGSGQRLVTIVGVAAVLALLVAIVPVSAQFPSTPDDPGDQPAGAGKGKKGAAAAPSPNVAGNWTGELTQVGSQTPYKFEISINARGAETKYPDLECAGKLTRAGSSKSYVFFVEVITKGQADKGGRCPDGTITIARQGNDLAVGWFGSIQNSTVVAFGTLKKK
jgi:hypothetical protein